jgi:hypothetical protein
VVAAFELDSNKSNSNNGMLKSGYVIMMYDIMLITTSTKSECNISKNINQFLKCVFKINGSNVGKGFACSMTTPT